MVKDFSEISYYQGIYGDHVALGNGDIVVGYNIFFPELWNVDKDGFGKIDESLL